MYWISDMAREHLLRLNGNWFQLPLDGDDHLLLVSYATLAEAQAVCDYAREAGRFMQPFKAPDEA